MCDIECPSSRSYASSLSIKRSFLWKSFVSAIVSSRNRSRSSRCQRLFPRKRASRKSFIEFSLVRPLFVETRNLFLHYSDPKYDGIHMIWRKWASPSPVVFSSELLSFRDIWLPPLNPLTPKIWLMILPFSCDTFPHKLVKRIWCLIKTTST